MTKEQCMERLWIIQQWLDGETVQEQSLSGEWFDWVPFSKTGLILGAFLSDLTQIRIKPKAREWWLIEDPNSNMLICNSHHNAKELIGLEIYKDWKIVHVREVEP